ncbi:MAG: PD-(D/E)XK nuclease family protein [Anaerolineales bacterium]|nr:PD-(D/E)XK nuclease family protein [Anaerolineales bacterium]
MKLPDDFQFNQSNLQDYVDCRRRFQYRHVMRLAWPGIEAEPVIEHERFLKLGGELHRMIQQHVLGVSQARLSLLARDEDLKRWWENYLHHPIKDLPGLKQAEESMSTPLAGHRLVAKYDLLAIEPGVRAVIVDWKATRRRPSRTFLAQRLQTRVYPYVFFRASLDQRFYILEGAGQVEMIYWFAEDPHNPERFLYDDDQFEADEVYLSSLIEEIKGLGESEFNRTAEELNCLFCRYRSLCQRGIRAGSFQDWTQEIDESEELSFDFDFDQVAEIEF